MLKLQLFEDPGHYVKLTTLPVTIGRDGSNDLILADPRVSDFHAEINGDPEGLYIVDLLSASGTLVNEHRVVDRTLRRFFSAAYRIGSTINQTPFATPSYRACMYWDR